MRIEKDTAALFRRYGYVLAENDRVIIAALINGGKKNSVAKIARRLDRDSEYVMVAAKRAIKRLEYTAKVLNKCKGHS